MNEEVSSNNVPTGDYSEEDIYIRLARLENLSEWLIKQLLLNLPRTK